jgi:lipoate-protein ligase A
LSRRPNSWRLLVHPPADGAWNLAVDEAILEGYLGSSPDRREPTLRLYSWDPPALSLGKSQIAESAHDGAFLRGQRIDLVRRPTGGLAVLHENERTYSVVGSLRRAPFDTGVLGTYRLIARALEKALRTLGVDARASAGDPSRSDSREPGPACFALTSDHEITVGGRKLIGSAQLRRGRAFLQHGSIPMRTDTDRLAGALGHEVAAGSFTGLRRALGREIDPRELDRALCESFESCFGISLEPGRLSSREELRAAQLRCWKHDSRSWTLNGRLGERERKWGPLGSDLTPAR